MAILLRVPELSSASSGMLSRKERIKMDVKITSLHMERQCFINKADEDEYIKLYRDTQSGQNVYWNGFGQPSTLTFRADFKDIEFNRDR